MNQILIRQNGQVFIDRLAAQRELYDEEKRWISLWIVISGLVAVLGSGALAYIKMVNAYIILGAALIMLLEFILLYIIRKRGQDAARIQELFDCDLLEMQWNDILAKRPDDALIAAAAARYYQRVPLEKRRLDDWYDRRIEGMPLTKARVYCQKENIEWDLRQRKEYIIWVSVALFVLAVILVVISIAANLSAPDFFVGPVLLSLPIFTAGLKHVYDHFIAVQRLQELQDAVKELIAKADSGSSIDETTLTQRSRDLQNEIFHHRSENSPVFSWFYELIKTKNEKQQSTLQR
jgi:hypothetical protein